MWTWLDLSKVIIGVIESGETIDDIDFGGPSTDNANDANEAQ